VNRTMPQLEYKPTSVSAPGGSLADLLEERGISQKTLCQRLGRSEKNLSQIIHGKAPITADLALDLEQVLGTPARFWLAREARYRESLTREAQPKPGPEDLAWVREFPYKKMSDRGWLPPAKDPVERHNHLLRFFGVVNRTAFSAWAEGLCPSFRKADAASGGSLLVAAWLRQGEKLAEGTSLPPYSKDQFESAVKEAKGLTSLPMSQALPALERLYAEAGVAVLFIEELPGMGVWGATRWLGPRKALIQITLRYKTSDHLWFTVFHESCHVLRHSKRRPILELSSNEGPEEEEANQFAADLLIPPGEYETFWKRGNYSASEVKDFAEGVGIDPGFVVARLQRDNLIPYNSILGSLKRKLVWGASGPIEKGPPQPED
jgi:HTH-type transcriptional regulator / antitoxin HigA